MFKGEICLLICKYFGRFTNTAYFSFYERFITNSAALTSLVTLMELVAYLTLKVVPSVTLFIQKQNKKRHEVLLNEEDFDYGVQTHLAMTILEHIGHRQSGILSREFGNVSMTLQILFTIILLLFCLAQSCSIPTVQVNFKMGGLLPSKPRNISQIGLCSTMLLYLFSSLLSKSRVLETITTNGRPH